MLQQLKSNKSRFQTKLLILMVVGIVLPVVASTSYSFFSSSRLMTEILENDMQTEAEDNAENIDLFLENIRSDVLYLSQTPPIQGLIRAQLNDGVDPLEGETDEEWRQRLEAILLTFVGSSPHYDQLRYLDETGQERARVNVKNGQAVVVAPDDLQNKSEKSYFLEAIALSRGEIYVSPINLNRERGEVERPLKPVIRYATPIYDDAGENRGALVANIRMAPLFELAANDSLQASMQQQLMVVNSEGYYLAHPDPDKTWGFDLGHEERLQNDYPAALSQEILSGGFDLLNPDKDYLLSYHTINPGAADGAEPFVLVYQTPKDIVFGSINRVRNFSIAMILLCLAIILPIAMLTLRQVLRPLVQLTDMVSGFAEQIKGTFQSHEDMADQQSASMQSTNATIGQLNQASKQSSQKAEVAANVAQQALKQLDQGQQQAGQTLEEMDDLQSGIEAIAQQAHQLNSQVEQIGSFSVLVGELATQTNMLAFNASVEAVRAGESGRGFAVVAKEIRKLADESQQSGQTIQKLVESIQQATQTVVTMSEKGRLNVNQVVTTTQQMSALLTEIAEAMQQVVSGSEQIATNSQNQAFDIDQVAAMVSQLNAIASQSAADLRQTKTGTEQLQAATAQLRTVV